MKQRMFAVAALAALVAAVPVAPFHISSFKIGKPASGIVTNGKPVVVVAFASWCAACLNEMPEVIGDYERLKDRVRFIGVDYMDNPKAAKKTIAQYKIPFDVVMDRPNESMPTTPADPNEQIGALRLEGITPKMFAKMTNGIKNMPAALNAKVKNAAAYCASHDDAACIAYAKSKGIEIGPAPGAASSPAPKASSKAQARTTSLALPRSFIIDSTGTVRAVVEGYSPQMDLIGAQLAKLSIK